jgi:hypothetical protein
MNIQKNSFRQLRNEEEAILRKLLEIRFPGHDELVQQLFGLQVKSIDAEGSLQLLVAADIKAPIIRGVVAEARYADLDTQDESNAYVNILLHVNEGQLSMLEIYKDDHSKIIKRPNPNELHVFSQLSP